MTTKVSKQLVKHDAHPTLIPAQAQRISEALGGDIPEWAKQQRPGRGSKAFTYIPHGYVASKLNETFGPFWDWQLIPIGGEGQMYSLIEYDDVDGNGRILRRNKEVAVIGVLTI